MRGLIHNTLVVLFLLSFAVAVHADKIDDYIQKQMQWQHIPGLSLAVVKDGKIVKAKGYGLANIELKAPATPETVYQLASVTKQFTATAIMLLVQDGKIGLDDKIGQYVDKTPDSWKEITIRHLLTHTSGIKDYLNELRENSRQDTTPEKIIGLVTGLPLNFAPGEKWSYSNTGYVLLAMIVHKVSGKPYDLFLGERVFKPLGMNSTRRSSLDDVIPHRAGGYVWNGSRWQNSIYLNPTLWDNGDGGMLSTVLDLAKWDAALYGESVLKDSTKQQMWTAVKLTAGKDFNYGFGWGLDKVRGHRLISHSGGRPGTSTNFSRYVEDKLSVIMLTNTGANIPRLCAGIARFYLPDLLPPRPPAMKIASTLLAGYAGRYEVANNRMLTLREEKGRLVEQYPGLGEWLPETETTFVSEDMPVRITFDRNTQGEVTGMTWKTEQGERKVPRVGPLIHSLKPQPDPNTTLTNKILEVLKALEQGGKPVADSPDIAPGAKKDFGSGPVADFTGLQSLAYITEQNIADRGIERHEGKVARIRYYKLVTGREPRYILVHLTADNLFTDLDVVED